MKKFQKNMVKCLIMILTVAGIMFADKEISRAASTIMIAYEDYLVSNTFGNSSSEIYTKYIDLNDDGSKEMVILYLSGSQYKLRVCTYIDEEVVAMNSKDIALKSWGSVSAGDNQIFIKSASGAFTVYQVNDTEIKKCDTYLSKKTRGTISYYKNNRKISKSNYAKIVKSFKLMKASKHRFNMSLNKTKTKVYLGQTKPLSVTGTIATVQWESRKKSVATVDQDGVVTGVGEGTAVIVAKIGNYKLYCDVTVEFDEEAAKDNIEIKLYPNGEDGELYVEMTNHNDFPVSINGTGKYYDEYDNTVQALCNTGITTLIPECTIGRVCESYKAFYSCSFEIFSLSKVDENDEEAIAMKNVMVESPVITQNGATSVIRNNYDEELWIRVICAWCDEDGNMVKSETVNEKVGYSHSQEYSFTFSGGERELAPENLTCRVTLASVSGV